MQEKRQKKEADKLLSTSLTIFTKLFYSLEHIEQQSPELIYSSYLESLVRRVNASQGWAKRDHLEVWILLKEESTLKARVYSANLRLYAKQRVVALQCRGQQR